MVVAWLGWSKGAIGDASAWIGAALAHCGGQVCVALRQQIVDVPN